MGTVCLPEVKNHILHVPKVLKVLGLITLRRIDHMNAWKDLYLQ